MTATWHLAHAVPLMDQAPGHLYDCRDQDPEEGELSLELPGPRSRYEQLAAVIRREIYDGTYAPGDVLLPELALAAKHGMSRALVNRALQLLGDEELVSQEQGRGTYVCPRRVYRVAVAVPFPGGQRRGRAASLRAAIKDSAKAEPAVRAIESAEFAAGAATISLLVEAADGDWAVHAAKVTVRAAGGAWDWKGWDLTLASYQCEPAGDAGVAAP
jgi:Bacterial regulatory proteins, gntR family